MDLNNGDKMKLGPFKELEHQAGPGHVIGLLTVTRYYVGAQKLKVAGQQFMGDMISGECNINPRPSLDITT